MSQSQTPAGAVAPKTPVPATQPIAKPVPLDPSLLRQVAGGLKLPNANW